MASNDGARPPFLGGNWLTALAVAGIVFVVATLGSLQYSGLIERMGEWQFQRLGLYMPVLSVLAWVALAGLLLAAVGWLIARRRPDAGSAPLPLDVATRRNAALRNALIVLGFLAGLVALGGAINLVLLPKADNTEQLLTPATFGPGRSGNVRLEGFRVAGPMARYSEGVLFWKKDIFLVPLTSRGGADGADPVKVFAQVTRYEAGTKVPQAYRGTMRQAALPRELYPLYAGQGIAVQENAAVLFRDTFSMALPTLLLIGESAVVALIAFATALIIHRRRNRVISV